jgi:nucleotide-binding universal stress UspA family protein
MKILAALDLSSQSTFVVTEVARLAANTWADVTLLGIEPEAVNTYQLPFSKGDRKAEDHPLIKSLRENRNMFQNHFGPDNSPYNHSVVTSELVEVENGFWEDLQVCRGSIKQLNTRLRPGNPAKAVLTEARNSQCDLIVLGNSMSIFGGVLAKSVKKILFEADTSVLMVAESKKPRRIVACLDHDNISQPSLELINQMVTLYDADLEIVGLTTQDTLASNVDSKMGEIIKYYAANKIKALVRFVEENRLATFAAQAAQENLVALWMGKKSLLSRLFHPRSVEKLLSGTESSLLILR